MNRSYNSTQAYQDAIQSRAKNNIQLDLTRRENQDYSTHQSHRKPQHLTQTAMKFYHEKRRQNQLLISINCSKAMDSHKLQEFNQQIQQYQFPQAQPRSQSQIGAGRPLTQNQVINQLKLTKVQDKFNQSQDRVNIKSYIENSHRQSNIHGGSYQARGPIVRSNTQNKSNINDSIQEYNTIINQSFQGTASSKTREQDKVTKMLQLEQERQNLNKSISRLSINYNLNNSIVDQSDIFAQSKQQPKELMYKRAMNQLKNLLKSKGIQDDDLNKSNYDLFHFHIDAFDNDIKLNKFETFNEMEQISFMGRKQNTNSSLNELGAKEIHIREKTHERQDIISTENLKIDISAISRERKKPRRLETEEQIQDALLRASPNIRMQKKSTLRNEYMMNIRSTLEDSVESDFSQRQNNFAFNQKAKKYRTILYSNEVDDNDKDYLQMEIKEFVQLSQDQLKEAYNRLQKSINVIFSGAVNTLINKLDPRKIQARQIQQQQNGTTTKHNNGGNSNRGGSVPLASSRNYKNEKKITKLNEVEQHLIDELKQCRENNDKKLLIYGQWNLLPQQGSIPDSREGATAIVIDNNLYVFGGFSRDLFNDVRVFDLNNQRWRYLQQTYGAPHGRFAHTMVPFDKKLVVFGGAGTYISSIKMRLSFNDVQIFDTESEKWLKEPEIEGAPRKRMNHAAAMFGGIMLIHGGSNTEQKKVMNDFAMFDMEKLKWIDCKVYIDPHHRIDDKHFSYDNTNENMIGFRQMHTMTSIYDQEHYNENYQGLKKRRIMWTRKRKFNEDEFEQGLRFTEGIFMFGGVNQQGQLQNDLWLITPHHYENDKIISPNCEYMTKPGLSMMIQKIDNYSGRPPCPRISHQATVFKDWNKHYLLVIYGGRNDSIYAKTLNVALNDICIYNVMKNEWMVLAMYGQMPCSRWSHCFTVNSGTCPDGFLVFGGVNLKNYCKSRIYQYQILNKWYTPKNDEQRYEVDEKLEMLFSTVKEKIEIIKEHIHNQGQQ